MQIESRKRDRRSRRNQILRVYIMKKQRIGSADKRKSEKSWKGDEKYIGAGKERFQRRL